MATSLCKQVKAQRSDESAEADERRALRYDFGEGLLEIGLSFQTHESPSVFLVPARIPRPEASCRSRRDLRRNG